MDWRVAQEGFIHSFLSSFCLFLLISAAATKERIKHTVTAAELRDKDTDTCKEESVFYRLFYQGLPGRDKEDKERKENPGSP